MVELIFPVLLADIGGTNARFAVLPNAEHAAIPLGQTETRQHATLGDALANDILKRTELTPKSFVFAVAGPVHPDVTRLTNFPWEIAPRALIAQFGLSCMILVNDFEAQALALPALKAEDVVVIGEVSPAASGTRVVVGPGTGLGAAGLIDVAGMLVPVPGEGGHVGVVPVSERDFAIWPNIPRPEGATSDRLSAELLLQGVGLIRIAQAIAKTDGVVCPYAVPADVTAGAERGEAIGVEALSLFCSYLGQVAGDLALVYLPKGGVFLAGGIAPRILNALKSGGFRAAFEDKWPHGKVMAGFSTAVVVHPQSGLLGLEAFSRRPEAYALDMAGRMWLPA